MKDDDVTEWIRLVKAGSHGVVIKRLPVASSVSANAQVGAAGSRNRASADKQGNCQAELWKLPRPSDENGSPEVINEVTAQQAERFIRENAAADQRGP